jgi:hypothetical protein
MADPAKLSVVTAQQKSHEALVKHLEHLAEEARAGQIEAVVTVAFRPDGTFGIWRYGHYSDLHIVGALEFAKHDIMKHNPGDES